MMRKQVGFSYLAMLFIIAVLGVTLTKTYERSDTIAKREKEKELLFVGNQYRQAITSYYNQSPSGFKELPAKLEHLLKDNRFVETKRHLRRRYTDPMTGEDFGMLLDGNGRIKGVVSASRAEVLQVALFDDASQALPAAGKVVVKVYSDVKFEYVNNGEQPVDGSISSGLQ